MGQVQKRNYNGYRDVLSHSRASSLIHKCIALYGGKYTRLGVRGMPTIAVVIKHSIQREDNTVDIEFTFVSLQCPTEINLSAICACPCVSPVLYPAVTCAYV